MLGSTGAAHDANGGRQGAFWSMPSNTIFATPKCTARFIAPVNVVLRTITVSRSVAMPGDDLRFIFESRSPDAAVEAQTILPLNSCNDLEPQMVAPPARIGEDNKLRRGKGQIILLMTMTFWPCNKAKFCVSNDGPPPMM